MCGIIGAVASRNIVPDLLDGMRLMEYRGYDSSGIATIDGSGQFLRQRQVGKVEQLAQALQDAAEIRGTTAIGHTRWATHGPPTEINAHPLVLDNRIAIACNGIIENYEMLKAKHVENGRQYSSETDTEVILHELASFLDAGLTLTESVAAVAERLSGSFAFAVISTLEPSKIVVTKRGSPLLIGFSENETYVASDAVALAKFVTSVLPLENGEIAEIAGPDRVSVFDSQSKPIQRESQAIHIRPELVELAHHSHYMQKEIFEQGSAVANTLEGKVTTDKVLESAAFGTAAAEAFDQIEAVRILACGTSYHAGLVARIWLEALGIPCETEIASEFRYRTPVVPDNTLAVFISQSGETADTLAACERAAQLGCRCSLAICNSLTSSLTRITDFVFHTQAGPEISVASTKAFTTQLAALTLLTVCLGRRKTLTTDQEKAVISELRALPSRIEAVLAMDAQIAQLSEFFADKEHVLLLGRGTHYPIALEGALKLKEISYIHADAYPAGELKHGPLALIDAKMPTIAVAPNNHLLNKLKSNIQEVRARGGKLFVFSDIGTPIESDELIEVIEVVSSGPYTSPIIHTIALQLLAYHVAIIKGTDVDNPRNLAKSVTVE